METISLIETRSWSGENLEEMVSYATDTCGAPCGRTQSAVVRIPVRTMLPCNSKIV
jgi:hypothetical protein